jgi:amino acid transporter
MRAAFAQECLATGNSLSPPELHIAMTLHWLSPDRLKRLFLGAPLDPLSPKVRQHIALAAFLAWVGLGADGLSSANYGPEEAFLALGQHTQLALYLAVATALTVFIIAFAYNQVIELFPNGGGGYKVATELIGSHAGLLSGSALIIDYVLTIAISVASGVDALFSLVPPHWQMWKLPVEFAVVALLTGLNLRGMKEPIAVLVPLFLGFLLTHAVLIVAGIGLHADSLPNLIPDTISDTRGFAAEIGMVGVIALLLKAFAMGGGTYTGIEAVSNNVGMLREPRVRTGKWTMLYMALSLAFTAAGLIVLYLLWGAAKEEGRTLNATVFESVLMELFGGGHIVPALLAVTLAFAAALLFVAANTGFLGGPAVLANMAVDRWMPHQFSQLSDRLVTQDGIVVMGAAAIGALWITGGEVHLLVVLYSINVFLTFSLCLAGLCRYWLTHRETRRWILGLGQSLLGFIVTFGILLVTLVEKFADGAWFTVLATGFVFLVGLAIKRHYDSVNRQLAEADALFGSGQPATPRQDLMPDPRARTAALFLGSRDGVAMHTLLAALTLFPNQFKNVILLTVGEIDTEQFHGQEKLTRMRAEIEARLERFASWCERRGIATDAYVAYGTETVELLDRLAGEALQKYPNTVFFASKLLFHSDNVFTRLLHNSTALSLQRLLHLRGVPMVILPMKV